MFLMALSLGAISAGCGGSGGGDGSGHWDPNDPTPVPTVTLTSPRDLATNVFINTKISATFSEAMAPATINTTTFTLKQGITAVPGSVNYTGVTAVFTPDSRLTANTTYTATITSAAKDPDGNALASNYVWTFTTGVDLDATAPTVTLTVPANAQTNVLTNTKVSANFSEAMDPLTLTSLSFTLRQGATAVPGSVNYSGVTAIFTPDSLLTANTTYTATITTVARDLAGNALASNYVWTFTTGVTTDTTAPTVTLTVPANARTNVLTNTKVSATFSEAMNPLTLTNLSFTLRQGTTVVPGSVSYSGVTAVFTPTSALALSTTYNAKITTVARDLAGNALASSYDWTFTTGATADTTRPTVTATINPAGATGVPVNTKVGATFSEAMDPLTLTNLSFTFKQGVTVVPGTVTYSGVSVVFTPASNLAFSTVYTATITTVARDLAGNALASDYVWSWTTGVAPDTTAPRVIATINPDGATGVSVNTKVGATFSEAMDPLTLTNLTFTLKQGLTTVPGTVIYSGVNAVFTPTSALAFSTTYTATITTVARDLAGNALASNYVWTFTTGVALDSTAPTVTLAVPADGDTGVCINKKIAATFSEAMDPLTLTNLSFTVSGVTGTVSYDAITRIATFTPTSDLATGTLYTATVTTGAEDLAGNPLTNNYVWSFTTGISTCALPVSLGAVAPFGGFGGGAGVTNQGTLTIINGDIGTTGVSTTVTGFRDSVGDVYTVTPLNDGMVNGRIYTDAPPPGGAGVGGNAATMVIATAAASDALIAYNSISPGSLPGGANVGNQLGGLTLTPGIYLAPAPGSTFLLTGSDLTLDGQGNPDAVWIFQAPASLTVGAPGFPRSIILTNGANARNVFWYVGSAARIENRSNMVGTIIASAGVTISTAGELATTTLDGRALGLYASVTMVNTLINVPAP